MMSDRPGIELSTVQLVSSMGAAVTGAVLTSYIGDGGTILGTAIGAGASTAGFAVYKHYLARTKEKVAPVIVEHARQWTPTGTVASDSRPTRHDGVPRADVTRADLRRPDDATRVDRPLSDSNVKSNGNGDGRGYTAADWEQAQRTAPGWAQPTQAEPGWGPDPTRQDLPRPGYGADPTRQDAAPTRTQYGTVRTADGSLVNGADSDGSGLAGSGSAGSGGSGSGGSGSGGSGSGDGRHSKPGGGFLAGRPRWLVPVATAAAVFIVVLIAITVVELGTGKPISASVWNRSQTGTTLGGSHKTTATPSTTPTPTRSATAPGSAGATGGAQSSPTPGTTPTGAPTPTPSSVPTVGSTRGATAPASGGAGAGAAGSGTVAPGQ
jgi:uncharacterized membrane protein YgcG